MQLQVFTVLAFAVCAASVAEDAEGSPVRKVVKLMKDLKAKLGTEAEYEERLYNRFACWCETTAKAKAVNIAKGEVDIRVLGQQILALKGKVETYTAEIAEQAQNVAEKEDKKKKQMNIRMKENAKYMKMQQESKEGIETLEKAIQVLNKATGFLQADAVAKQAMSSVRSVLDTIPLEADLNADHVSFLSEFVKSGDVSSYNPQSATIMGILTDMYSTFAKNLQDATMAEMQQNMAFEQSVDADDAVIKAANKIITDKTTLKAADEQSLATATASYDSTADQKTSNIAFFDEMKTSCALKHTEYKTRIKLRAEEKKGIEEAIHVLDNDKNRRTLAKSSSFKKLKKSPSFLQIELADSAQAASVRAYSVLKKVATSSHSLRLGMLAVRTRSAKAQHFAEVVKEISGMLAALKAEGQADVDKMAYCHKELQKIKGLIVEVKWKEKKEKAKISEFKELIALQKTSLAETVVELNASIAYRSKTDADRKAEHAKWLATGKEDRETITLLAQAKAKLTAFYTKHKVSLMQEDASFLEFQKEHVEFVSAREKAAAEAAAADDDDEAADGEAAPTQKQQQKQQTAPDASLSKNGNNKGAKQAIVSLMDYIMEDIQAELVDDSKDEVDATTKYLEAIATAKELESGLQTKINGLQTTLAKVEEEEKAQEKNLAANKATEAEENHYKANIKPDCDWMKANVKARKVARTNEADGLRHAQKILGGEAVLLQVPQTTEVEEKEPNGASKLMNIRFLGIEAPSAGSHASFV